MQSVGSADSLVVSRSEDIGNMTYSASELAAMRLPVLPHSHQNIVIRAAQERWPFVTAHGRGGEAGIIKLYTVPEYVHVAIAQQRLEQREKRSALVEAIEAAPVPVLTDRQRATAAARAAIVLHMRRLSAQMVMQHDMFERTAHARAIDETVAAANAGRLPEHLQEMVPVACSRRRLSRATLYTWDNKFILGAPDSVERLAHKSAGATKQHNWMVKHAPWMEVVLKLYGKPQKPSLRAVHEELPKHLPPGVPMPSYNAIRRYMRKMGNVERQRGRLGSREIKSMLPFVRRDTSVLWPTDVYLADGHTFDAEVSHPRHGRPFRPEVTSVIDAASRRVVGWSIDLAESGLAVLDAIRHAVQTGGVPAIFYVDNGSGYHNVMISAHGTGLLDRLGTRLETSIAYNPQGHGMVEALNKMWVRAAKELPTYIGADMDAQAANAVHKTVRRDVKLFGLSRLLMPWSEFLRFSAEKVAAYNARPHRGLPTIIDEKTGKRRHLSPDEAWTRGIVDGAPLVELEPGEADLLFRPQRECRVLRGEITLFGNRYFSHDLTEYHGDGVRVGYDIHDASQVWVYDADGLFICKAQFEANKRAFFPENVLQQAARKRAEGREKRLRTRLTEVREELHGVNPVLEDGGVFTIPAMTNMPDVRERLTVVAGEAVNVPGSVPSEPVALPVKRTSFGLPSERYEWLKARDPESWTDADCAFLRDYVADPDGYAMFAQRFGLLGLAWSGEDDARVNVDVQVAVAAT